MKILIIADPARLDYFDFITSADSSIKKWELIWDYKYSERSEKKDLLTLANDKPISIHYWSDFFTPYELIRKINPDKIVFFEIIDLWQIPLVIAARKKGVSTFFIEHGVGNSVEQVINRFKERLSFKTSIKKYGTKIIWYGIRVLRNRIFYFSQMFNLNSFNSFFKYIFLPINLKRYTPIECLSKNLFKERTPEYAILFNRNNVAPFLIYNVIEERRIITNGVPFFDKNYRAKTLEENHIFFVEHPYLEEGILAWDDLFHEKIARS